VETRVRVEAFWFRIWSRSRTPCVVFPIVNAVQVRHVHAKLVVSAGLNRTVVLKSGSNSTKRARVQLRRVRIVEGTALAKLPEESVHVGRNVAARSELVNDWCCYFNKLCACLFYYCFERFFGFGARGFCCA